MSVGVVDKTTGDRIPTAGNPLDKVGNLANLTTTAKGSAVEAINEVNATKANQTQLATVEASTTASKAYSANDYLVLGGVLYKVTANIAQGGTIVTEGASKNVDLATVGGELSEINSNISTLESGLINKLNFYKTATFGGDVTIDGNGVWACLLINDVGQGVANLHIYNMVSQELSHIVWDNVDRLTITHNQDGTVIFGQINGVGGYLAVIPFK